MFIEAESPAYAAEQALTVHRDPDSLALEFDVFEAEDGKPTKTSHVVDLLDYPYGVKENDGTQ